MNVELLKEFNFVNLKDSVGNKEYNLVYLNYDRINGIKLLKNIDELTTDEKREFYRIYIFNDNCMITIFNFGKEVFKYNKIEKDDFESYVEREVYLNKEYGNKKLKVRIGNLKIDNSREVVQYIDFVKC